MPPPPGFETGDCVVAVADVFVQAGNNTETANALVRSLGLAPDGIVDGLTWGPSDGCPIIVDTFMNDQVAVPFRLRYLYSNRYRQVPVVCALDAPVTVVTGLSAPPPPATTAAPPKRDTDFTKNMPWFPIVVAACVIACVVCACTVYRLGLPPPGPEVAEELPSRWAGLRKWKGAARAIPGSPRACS